MNGQMQYQATDKKGQWQNIGRDTAQFYLEKRYTNAHSDFLFRQLERGREVELDQLGINRIRAIKPER
jgi:hypothetical protein